MAGSSNTNKPSERGEGFCRRDVIKGAAAGLIAATGTHAVAFEAQSFRVEAEEMEEGRVVIVVIDDVLDGLVAELVGGAVHVAALETPARDPHTEAVGVVIAPHSLWSSIVLDDRQASHLTTPMHDGRI